MSGQLALLPPWWSESRGERVAGDRQLVRYRCRRCETWSAPQDARKAPAGACRFCVPLPLPVVEPPPGYAAPAPEAVDEGVLRREKAIFDAFVERVAPLPFPLGELAGARVELLDVLVERAAVLARLDRRATARTAAGGDPVGRVGSACACDLRDRRWNLTTGRCEACRCRCGPADLAGLERALELCGGLPARGCTPVELQLDDGTTVSGIACTRGKPARTHLASATGTACGRRGGSVPMAQQTRDRDLVTCLTCLRRSA